MAGWHSGLDEAGVGAAAGIAIPATGRIAGLLAPSGLSHYIMPMRWLAQSVQVGRLSLPAWILASIVALAVTYAAIHVLFHRDKAARTAVFNLIFNAFFIFFLVWKLSPAVFQFSQILRQPAALLYLPGGTAGSIAGGAAAVIYLTIKLLRARTRAKRTEPIGRRIIQGLAVSVAVFGAVFLLAGSVAGLQQRSSRAQAPDFQLTGLDAGSYRLTDFTGKYVILNFWASWCGPCRAEIPELVKFHEDSGEDTVVLLAINQTTSEAGAGAVRYFAEQQNMKFPILLDSANRVHVLYGIRGIPTTIIIDPDGLITAKRTGAVTSAWLKSAVR